MGEASNLPRPPGAASSPTSSPASVPGEPGAASSPPHAKTGSPVGGDVYNYLQVSPLQLLVQGAAKRWEHKGHGLYKEREESPDTASADSETLPPTAPAWEDRADDSMDQLLANTTERTEDDTMDWTGPEDPARDEETAGPLNLNAESLDYLNEPATEKAMRSAEIAEVHREGLPAFIRTDVPPQVSRELERMQAMKEREVEHVRYRSVGGEFATPELAAVQQAIRTTLNNHFDTLADPPTKLQTTNPYKMRLPRPVET